LITAEAGGTAHDAFQNGIRKAVDIVSKKLLIDVTIWHKPTTINTLDGPNHGTYRSTGDSKPSSASV
jgi:hypothetical protein